MKIELLNDNKIKLFLTHEDLVEYGLTYETLNYDEPDTKCAFKDMLIRAKDATGISFDGSRLMVEARPTSASGCTLTITKQEKNKSSKKLSTTHKCFFSFASVDDFLDFRNVAKSISASYAAYSVEDILYIAFEEKDGSESQLFRLASEFGEKCSFYMESILEERAERLSVN